MRACAVVPPGYSSVALAGEAVTDQVLQRMASANAGHLTSLRVLGTHHVSDAGLCAVIRASPQLQQLVLQDAGAGVDGHCLPLLLQQCRQLESLHVEGTQGIDWGLARHPAASWCEGAHGLPSLAPAGAVGSPQLQQAAGAAAVPPATHLGVGSCSSVVDQASGVSHGPDAAVPAPAPASMQQPLDGSHSTLLPAQRQQQQQQPDSGLHSRRLSSSSGSGHTAAGDGVGCGASSGQVQDQGSDDGRSSSSLGPGSETTSISVPSQAMSALTAQLRNTGIHSALGAGDEHVAQGAPAAVTSSQPCSGGGPVACRTHTALRRLRVRFANTDELPQLLQLLPGLTELQVDGPAHVVHAAAQLCPQLQRLAYLVSSPGELDAVLGCLADMQTLQALELEVKGMVLSCEQLRVSASRTRPVCGVCLCRLAAPVWAVCVCVW